MGTIFQLKCSMGLAVKHIRRHVILLESIVFRKIMAGCNDPASRQFEIASPVDLICRLGTWPRNILFDVNAI